MRGIVWFKKDLRLHDHPALHAACQTCPDGIIAIYFINTEMWKKNDTSHCQIEFILRGLKELSLALSELNIPLIIETVKRTADIPEHFLKIIQKIQAEKVFFNREYEINEKRRDRLVVDFLTQNQIQVQHFHDQLILPYNKVKTGQGEYFKVFTPFKRQWLKVFEEIKCLPKPKATKPIKISASPVPEKLPNIHSNINPTLWIAGEKTAQKILKKFTQDKIFHYHETRDFPALDETSKLSPYLATGMISSRTCFLSALIANQYELDTGNQGALTWMSELIWREFYRHILIAVPRVCMNKAYQLETENLPWRYDEKLLTAWQEGKTGFPLVDAAMRQLNTIGWMHNRLRMVTAMFLSKNLFLDWRLGEKYFAQHLIDFDFASNNGGWQWSASTGTDAAPYFRVFNPTRQSERFDPNGDFIRKFCPELSSMNKKQIHHPNPDQYIQPIINYEISRAQVISAFKALK